MWALPRAEQPYSLKYPHLDVNAEVSVILQDLIPEVAPPNEPTHEPEESTASAPVKQAKFSQFNVSGYLGGKNNASRYLLLKHASAVPAPKVDAALLDANLGFKKTQEEEAPQTHMRRPDAAMEIYQPFTYTLPGDPLQFDAHLSENVRVEYDIDEADLAVLGLLATRYRVQMLPEVFEVVMSMLDLAAVLICLKMFPLERAAREERGLLSTVDNRRCAVCNWAECTDSNTIVFCDGCDVAVHQDCYGVHSIPEGRWLCRKCESGHGADIKCVLCPHTSGAFKQTTGGDWIHLVCALWTPIVLVPENTSFLEPIRDLDLVEKGRWSLNCYVCRSKRRGTCIQCAARDCYVAFHPTCAQTAGFFMTNCDHDFGEMLKQQAYLPVYCHRHSLQHAPQGFPQPSLEAARQALTDEQRQFKQQNISLFAYERYSYWRTKSQALILPQVVVGAVKRSLKRRLNIDLSSEVIEFFCRYWTIKKDQSDGVMFNRRLHHALEVAQHRVIRAEQSEEQERTPSELLDLVSALLKTLDPQAGPENVEASSPEATGPQAKSPKRPGVVPSATKKKGTNTPDKSSGNSAPNKSPAVKTRASAHGAAARRPPSTRKRMREQSATVASLRKLRSRRSS